MTIFHSLADGTAHICLLSHSSGQDTITGESIFQNPNTAMKHVHTSPIPEEIRNHGICIFIVLSSEVRSVSLSSL